MTIQLNSNTPTSEFCGKYGPVRPEIYNAGMARLELMLQRHARVLAFRMIVRFPSECHFPEPNKDFRRFLAGFRKNLKNNGLDPQFLWVRERDKSVNPHFHTLILIDGREKRSPYYLLEMAERLWQGYVCGSGRNLIERHWRGNGNAVRLEKRERGTSHFTWLSRQVEDWVEYMAKEATKGEAGENNHEFGASQLYATAAI